MDCLEDTCDQPAAAGGRLCLGHWWLRRGDRGEQTLSQVPAGLAGLVVTRRSVPVSDLAGQLTGCTIETLTAYLPPRTAAQLTVRTGTRLDGTPGLRVRKITVSAAWRRRGLASAMYDLARLLWPDAHVDHGVRTFAGAKWWAGYCAARGVDPASPAT